MKLPVHNDNKEKVVLITLFLIAVSLVSFYIGTMFAKQSTSPSTLETTERNEIIYTASTTILQDTDDWALEIPSSAERPREPLPE